MTNTELEIPTPDGPMVVHALGDEVAPVVLVLMPASGVTDGLLSVAGRVVEEGFRAIVPELYHRAGGGVTFDPATQNAQMRETMEGLSDAMVVSDVGALLAWLEDERPVGAIGFCMGGRFVVRVMAAFPDRVQAGAALHPSRLLQDGPDSPHLDLAAICGPLYVGFGQDDAIVPPEHWRAVDAQAQEHGKRVRIEVHPGADHGYMIPGPRFHADAADASWAGALDALEVLYRG